MGNIVTIENDDILLRSSYSQFVLESQMTWPSTLQKSLSHSNQECSEMELAEQEYPVPFETIDTSQDMMENSNIYQLSPSSTPVKTGKNVPGHLVSKPDKSIIPVETQLIPLTQSLDRSDTSFLERHRDAQPKRKASIPSYQTESDNNATSLCSQRTLKTTDSNEDNDTRNQAIISRKKSLSVIESNQTESRPTRESSVSENISINQSQLSSSAGIPPARIFCCPYCKKEFPFKSVLDRHLAKHTGEKSFRCLHCEAVFKHQGARHNHMKIKHYDKMQK